MLMYLNANVKEAEMIHVLTHSHHSNFLFGIIQNVYVEC